MLELHQFRHSAFCLKVRLGLEAKRLNYKVVEVSPGIGQIAIFRLSGQRKLPVLVDDKNVIADSSNILRYLERQEHTPSLFPDDPKQAAQAQLLESWADTTLAKSARAALIHATTSDTDLRIALLPKSFPKEYRKAIKKIPLNFLGEFSGLVSQNEFEALHKSLEHLSNMLKKSSWLVGESMSIADLAVAAQISLLKFHISSGEELAHKGCPEFKDDPKLESLFAWRDQLFTKILIDD